MNEVLDALTAEEKEELSILRDPVRWAEATLRNPINPKNRFVFRDYQVDMVSLQPITCFNADGFEYFDKRWKVYRCSRRAGKTIAMASEVLWNAFTKSYFRILIITPFDAQVRLIFQTIRNMMKDTFIHPVQDIQQPHSIKFKNGSTIIGMPAGGTSATKGGNIRSQGADLIVLDEIDYGVDDIIREVVMPIFVNNRKCQLIVSSTPSGRHGLFWEMSMSAQNKRQNDFGEHIEEFYVPCTRIPGWDERAEKTARKLSQTESKFNREYMAIFGEEQEGVFLGKFVDAALKDYTYGQMEVNPKLEYYMGVDWNEIYGVSIIILERNPKTQKVVLWKKDRIEKIKYTQLGAVEKIIEYYEEMPLKAIFFDHGFGTTQSELLYKYAEENNDDYFNKILNPIDFGGKVEMFHPYTNKVISKPAKPFMVNNCISFVEKGLFTMPITEDDENFVAGAMRGYKIKKISKGTNNPVYDCGTQDHELDATFLGLLAITITNSVFMKERQHARTRQVVSSIVPGSVEGRNMFNENKKTKAEDKLTNMLKRVTLKHNEKRSSKRPGTNRPRRRSF